MTPRRSIWWSFPGLTLTLKGAQPAGIGDDQLLEWLQTTVGWHAVEVSGAALQVSGAHPGETRTLVLAALEAASKLGTRTLRFTQVDLDGQLSKCVGVGLQAYGNLRKLCLAELNVCDEAGAQLAAALEAAEHLQTVSLCTVDMGADVWEAVGLALKHNTSIRKLKLRHCAGSPAAVLALCTALRGNSTLTTLDVAHNELQDAGMKRLCEALVVNSCVTTLSAAAVGLTAVAASGLAALLKRNKALTSVDVSANDLGPEGCAEVCKAVVHAPCLAALDLSGCRAGDAAVEALSRSLLVNMSLTVIKLRQNRIGTGGIKTLVASLKRSGRVLRSLDLSGNCMMGNDGAAHIAELLKAQLLGSLRMADCELSDASAFSLGGALKSSTTLSRLDLSSNQLTHHGIAMFAEVLKTASGLRILDLSYNWVGPRAASCLKGDGAVPTWMRKPRFHGSRSPFAPYSGGHILCQVTCEISIEFRQVEHLKYLMADLDAGLVPERATAVAAGAASRQHHHHHHRASVGGVLHLGDDGGDAGEGAGAIGGPRSGKAVRHSYPGASTLAAAAAATAAWVDAESLAAAAADGGGIGGRSFGRQPLPGTGR